MTLGQSVVTDDDDVWATAEQQRVSSARIRMLRLSYLALRLQLADFVVC